jgi:hypothetical protein
MWRPPGQHSSVGGKLWANHRPRTRGHRSQIRLSLALELVLQPERRLASLNMDIQMSSCGPLLWCQGPAAFEHAGVRMQVDNGRVGDRCILRYVSEPRRDGDHYLPLPHRTSSVGCGLDCEHREESKVWMKCSLTKRAQVERVRASGQGTTRWAISLVCTRVVFSFPTPSFRAQFPVSGFQLPTRSVQLPVSSLLLVTIFHRRNRMGIRTRHRTNRNKYRVLEL